ncbi:MAG: hypothetical protein JWN67_607, partial [Actinomycetia bacterium]|nr:hypothetical protein [Actinomycetes bacterium]
GVASSLPDGRAARLAAEAKQAFTEGFGTACLVGAVVVAVAAVVITLSLRRLTLAPAGATVAPPAEDPIEQLQDVPLVNEEVELPS